MNPVKINSDPFSLLSDELQKRDFSKLLVLTDENTQRDCFPMVKDALPAHFEELTIPAGEQYKTLETCVTIWDKMTAAALDRKALVINLGGGVLGDMGGFCASIYKRGIRFINMPTTLLSQVDASVGGKLGVDFHGLKNHLGVFNEPDIVLISPSFLDTLSAQEVRSGFAEIIKHGLIQDAAYFSGLNFENWKKNNWNALINRSVDIKKQVVQDDPKEQGLRKILNFGHTLGHALETYYLDSPKHLLHGEAIAVGMICEAWLSQQKTGLALHELEEISQKLIQVYGKINIDPAHWETILDLSLQDKKNEGKSVLFSLLESIGTCTYNIPVTREEMKQALTYYTHL
ncbi:3-dehydroquinate synthase [Algoriphagus faecimaris]|uniref:3-dehydroquinate synthase n=1 Tax=Algoriphagus faecimaris TaxID=686796 RepID=A0A1G6XM07_9BACT|nr:3-dehydroquinate synthase [Algoriphagus faecimaris]SDD78266.1 3-dehydroquinate synthase [Algoriphagus faecimaris]